MCASIGNRIAFFSLLCACVAACGPQQDFGAAAAGKPDATPVEATKVTAASEKNYADVSQKIDPEPIAASKPLVVSANDSLSQGIPVCTYTVRYPGHIDHEISWRQNQCKELSTDFLLPSQLEKLGKLDRLDKETLFELTEYHKDGVFYIEGEFTASIYPLNVAGVPHEVSVTD